MDLYNLRAQVAGEIATIEAAITLEADLVRRQFEAEAHADRPKRRRIAECGTDGGYHHHRRVKKEQACLACRMAHSAAERDRAKRKKAS